MADLYSNSNINTPVLLPNTNEQKLEDDNVAEGNENGGRMTIHSVHSLNSTEQMKDGEVKETKSSAMI